MAPNYDSDDVDVTDSEEEEQEVSKKRTKKWKDPNKPKRAMSAFFLYSQAHRQSVKEDNPDASFGEIARILAANFKELPDKEKRKWEKKAEQDKQRYQEEMKHYVPAEDPSGGGGGGGRKSKKAKKDPNAPKRNMSAYFLYSNANRERIKNENPDASFGDIARLISEEYKALPAKERKVWDDKAAADKARYQRELADYQG